VLTGAYNTNTLQVWCLLIDIPFILLHVSFEDGLFISVLKARQFGTNFYNEKSKSIWKNWKAARPLFSHMSFSNTTVSGAMVNVRVSKKTGTYSKG
jgi:predicted membrane protein